MWSVRLWLAVVLIGLLGAAGAPADAGKVALSLEVDNHEAPRGGQTGVDILAHIERGWHINGHKPTESYLVPTEVTFTLPPGISTDTVNYPRPDKKTFAFAQGKELLVYEGMVGMTTALSVPADFAGTRLRIEAVLRYQACNDKTCLPPATVSAEAVVPVSATVTARAAAVPAPARDGRFDVEAWMTQRGLPVTLLLVALLGFGLNLTPCVYPLISVTVAYFGSQARNRSARVEALAAVYVLGIVLSFSLVGVAAALSGGIFGAALQKPAVLVGIALMLTILSLSSFGLYQLQPPAWVMRRVSGSAHGALGSLFMGLTMGVVAAPCVGPFVLGLLVFVGSRQSVVLGLQLFVALGLGMGLPYLALAVAADAIKALPRSGEWLLWVERLFGVVLLGMAAYFIAPLLPTTVSRLLVPALAGVGGVYLGFVDRSGGGMRYFPAVKRSVGIVAVAIAAWAAVPGAARSVIRWEPLDLARVEAVHTAGRPVVIDFLAEWCIPCHEMDRSTFTDAAVRREAGRFAMFKADITQETDETSALASRYDVRGVPTLIFFDSSGTEVRRLIGYVGPGEMFETMRAIR